MLVSGRARSALGVLLVPGRESSTSPDEVPVVPVPLGAAALPVDGTQLAGADELVAPADVPAPVAALPALAVAVAPFASAELVALVPVVPVPVVPTAAGGVVPPNVAVTPVPLSVLPVAPVASVMPGAGAASGDLPLIRA